jgi:REP element-mobilizing transposase RayT
MRRSKQLALELGRYTVTRHRGGRPIGPNPRVRHLSRKPFPESHPCHVTLRVRAGMPSLRQEHVVREIEASFRRGRERKDFRLVHYSLQADHAHLIVEASDRSALGRGMKALAGRFARAVNRALGRRTGKVLADRYHLQILACPRQVRNALAYVLLHARRHAAKRIERLRRRGMRVAPLPNAGTLDGASSARWFAGWRRELAVDRSPPLSLEAESAVAEPRTWFLRRGWRLHGLIDPNEIPSALEA